MRSEFWLPPLGVLMVCWSLARFQLSWSTAVSLAVLVSVLVVVVAVMVSVAFCVLFSVGMVQIPLV